MAINIKTTGSLASNGVKLLVYGQAGAGKTSLIKTLPDPIVLSAEGGLLSIQDADLPYIEVGSKDSMNEVYDWLTQSHEAKYFRSVAIDSLSEVAEVILNYEKKINKKEETKMKKVIAIFAIVALAACGGASTEVKTDSTTVSTDTAAAAVDTTATVVDTTATK